MKSASSTTEASFADGSARAANSGRIRRRQAGTSSVCRYYVPPGLGDSHFFGRGTVECTQTGQKNPSFVLVRQFMQMFLPAQGACPANTQQIFRVFSNRADANHRYITDKTTRAQMASEDGSSRATAPTPS